jgi:hypothetical protein
MKAMMCGVVSALEIAEEVAKVYPGTRDPQRGR